MLALLFFFFYNEPATTEIYTLSLHDALPISVERRGRGDRRGPRPVLAQRLQGECRDPGPESRRLRRDRKSTRLNSSHTVISYAVFCLKKKKKKNNKLKP